MTKEDGAVDTSQTSGDQGALRAEGPDGYWRTIVPAPSEMARVEDEALGRAPPSGVPPEAAARKKIPIYSGLIKFFPDALAAVAAASVAGNVQHGFEGDLEWDRDKDYNDLDNLGRHLLDAGTLDSDGQRHTAKVVWRGLAALQKEIENDRK